MLCSLNSLPRRLVVKYQELDPVRHTGLVGDSLEAPLEQMRRGPLDYLTLDYLAEATMSILQKQRSRDPSVGYARDFVEMVGRGAADIVDKKIRIVANAGGVNPEACRDAVAKALNRPGVKVGIVSGDDILTRLDDMIERGVELKNLDTGVSLASIRPRVQSANVYFGAAPCIGSIQYTSSTRSAASILRLTTTASLSLRTSTHSSGESLERLIS